MVRWVFLAILVGVTAMRVYLYTPIEKIYTNGQKIKLTTTILDTRVDKISGIIINLPKNVSFAIGDVVEIVGNIDVRLTEENRKLLSLDIGEYRITGSEKSFRVLMAKLRTIVISKLLNWLPGDAGALAAGILVGGDNYMSKTGQNSFRRGGITHVVAASGYNVTVVAGWVAMILGNFLNKFLVMSIGIVSIILYIFLAGGTAAVVRAGMMAIIVIIGKIWGKESDGGWLLFLTSLIMISVNPSWFWDIGFQLSVAAMVGMIYLAGKSVLSQTLACQITTLPLILHYFGNLSVVAPLANILFLWPVPIIMPVLAIAIILGRYFAFLAWPLLFFMTEGVKLLSSADWANLQVNKMSWGWVIIYYAVLVLIKLKYFNEDWNRR